MTDSMKAAAIYARVSSERQKEEHTIASQTTALQEQATNWGYAVAPEWVFEDEGYSGALLIRPGLDRVRDLAAEGQLEALLVYSPDRLSRKYAYQVLLVEELARHGVEVRFIRSPRAETPEEHLLLQFQGMIAEYERAQIVERTRRGKRHRARAGSVNVLSGAPYGYRYIRKSEANEAYYEVVETEAAVVRRVFRRYTEDGISINAIARWLTEQGVATRNGAARWCRSVVWAMLRNPAYRGTACFGKTEPAERQRITRPLRQRGGYSARSSANRERPRQEWIEIPVPALVSEEQFELAQEQLERNKRHSPRRTREPTLLQNMLVCKRCGYAYYRTSTRTSKRMLYYYRCLGSDDHRYENGRVCESRPVRQDALDEVVWNSVMELLQDPALIRAEIDRRIEAARESKPTKRREGALQKEQLRFEKQMARLLDAYQEELLSLDELRGRMGELSKRARTVELELTALATSTQDEHRYLKIADSIEGFLGRLRTTADTLDVEARQKVLRLLVKEILVDHDTISIKHSIPVIDRTPSPPETSGGSNTSSYPMRSGRRHVLGRFGEAPAAALQTPRKGPFGSLCR
jgi:site-specific DNA recombinase